MNDNITRVSILKNHLNLARNWKELTKDERMVCVVCGVQEEGREGVL